MNLIVGYGGIAQIIIKYKGYNLLVLRLSLRIYDELNQVLMIFMWIIHCFITVQALQSRYLPGAIMNKINLHTIGNARYALLQFKNLSHYKNILFTIFIMCLYNQAFADYIVNPVTTYYTIYINNNTKDYMDLHAINLDNPYFVNKNRLFEVSQFAQPNSPKSLLPPHSEKAFAMVVHNFKSGNLEISLDNSGTGFRIFQSDVPLSAASCDFLQTRPQFVCGLDLSSPTSRAKVSFKIGRIDPLNPIGSDVTLYINIDTRK
jgi:hypothetical protein